MKKINIYLNDEQYKALSILCEETTYETIEEFANERFYNYLKDLWIEHLRIQKLSASYVAEDAED